MYSEAITTKHVERIEASLKIKLHRYSPAESWELTAYLTKLNDEHKLYDGNGQFLRKEYASFVRNERVLFQQDFLYSTRYITIERDGVEGGGVGPLSQTFWESQQILLALIAKLEEKNIDYYERGYPCDGILICDNKGGRQLGHTVIARALGIHRLVGWPHTRAMAASIDEPHILKLYLVDKVMLDNLPFFLKPTGWGEQSGYDKKAEHIQFNEDHGSRIAYLHNNTQSGFGVGSQYDINHNTEVSRWPYPRAIEIDLEPCLPQNPYTLSIQETTPYGRKNWWFKFSESVRKGRLPRWAYLFIPFYAEPKKYRRHPPDGWNPSESTMQMAWKVFNTSKEFVGKQVTLTREQMYWWESSYAEAMEKNALNLFLSNYSITPEQSFQHTSVSAINALTLDWMRTTASEGVAYELEGL